MGLLNFEYTYELEDLSLISVEPDNTLASFYIENNRQHNKLAKGTSDYDNMPWKYETSALTAQDVSDIGVKHYPQFGSYGYFTKRYEGTSFVVAPIFNKIDNYDAPTLNLELLGDTLRITIVDPENVVYECYRVIFRSGLFAEEYVTYDRVFEIPKPTATSGVYLLGYLDEQVASDELFFDYPFN